MKWRNNKFNLLVRIWNGIKIGWWAIMNPDPLQSGMLEMLGGLLELILKVSHEDKHYMTSIVVTNPETKAKQPIVRIWVGAGATAEPMKRIRELVEEVEVLKELVKHRKENEMERQATQPTNQVGQ